LGSSTTELILCPVLHQRGKELAVDAGGYRVRDRAASERLVLLREGGLVAVVDHADGHLPFDILPGVRSELLTGIDLGRLDQQVGATYNRYSAGYRVERHPAAEIFDSECG
jgi:hypothetical protein